MAALPQHLNTNFHHQNIGSVERLHFVQEPGSKRLAKGVPKGDGHITECPGRFLAAVIGPIFSNMKCLRAIPALRIIIFSFVPGADAIRRVPAHVVITLRASKMEVGTLHGMENPAAAMMQLQTMGQQRMFRTVRSWFFIEDP